MSWRELMNWNPNPYSQNPYNSQNPPAKVNSENCEDSGDRDSETESTLLEALADAVQGTDLTVTELRSVLSEEDLADWRNGTLHPETLRALARVWVDRRLMDRGQRPPGYDKVATCRQCGTVWLWTEGTFEACPWCWNRIGERPIPRPGPVRCGGCQHFRRIDHPHLGHCTVGQPEAPAGLWDTDKRHCEYWLPRR